ncbi:MAG: diaminopimelate epimerase, partial [Planctomycetota bacterium]|nr:diaminopimelate epimerase [Planctomycetota bacterium]
MRFIKMHGIGNDYVYVNAFRETVKDPAKTAIRVSDRHTAIGGDGLIMVCPPEQGVDAHVRMRMFNADGSESEMCGNGVRCVCKLAHDHGLSTANPMKVQTGRGVLTLRYTKGPDGKVDQVTVDMGEPILEAAKIPVKIPNLGEAERVVNFPMPDGKEIYPTLEAITAAQRGAGLEPGMTCVSMGNPHATFYCRDVAKIPLATIGPGIEHHAFFPRRINVHFVQVHSPTEVTMRTWERGSGITMACGTGA